MGAAPAAAHAESFYEKILDERPIPDTFPFCFMLESYIWRAIFMTSFALGVRLGGVSVVEDVVSLLLPSYLLFLAVYTLLPAGCFFLHHKYKSQLSVMDCRVILIVAAFLAGVGGACFNSNYFLPEGPPSYFMPGIVALSFLLFGPRLATSRRGLLTVTVGGAWALGAAITVMAGIFTMAAFFSLTLASLFAAVNLQILISEIISGNADMTDAHIIAIAGASYQHLIFSRCLGEYCQTPRQKTSLSLRRAILN